MEPDPVNWVVKDDFVEDVGISIRGKGRRGGKQVKFVYPAILPIILNGGLPSGRCQQFVGGWPPVGQFDVDPRDGVAEAVFYESLGDSASNWRHDDVFVVDITRPVPSRFESEASARRVRYEAVFGGVIRWIGVGEPVFVRLEGDARGLSVEGREREIGRRIGSEGLAVVTSYASGTKESLQYES